MSLAKCTIRNEKEQKLRTLGEDAEVGWTLVVKWASDESQKPAPAAQ
jgi:hypothetical protein